MFFKVIFLKIFHTFVHMERGGGQTLVWNFPHFFMGSFKVQSKCFFCDDNYFDAL